MNTFAKTKNRPARDMKAALLPVLGLCGKADDPIQSFTGALCIDSDGKDLVFWTASFSAIFASKIEAEELTNNVKMTIRPSCFGVLVEHIKKAKIRLDVEIIQASEDKVPKLHVTTENETLVFKDMMNPEHPDHRMFLKRTEKQTSTPEPAYFKPKTFLPFLNAFKNVQHVDIMYSVSESEDASDMHIRTTHKEPFVRFEAFIMGCRPSFFKQK